ncbi:MAG: type I-E CRISPR-associated protein Cse1/CasA [Deltaproteobacteria bacterium]|nr:type I-E CRISPR-associated protein Cse1/CasA [Deltaproteobacteria bacterium]
MENRYNLIDEPWIPVADVGKVSLSDIFSARYRALGGNPVEKIAVLNLLLAIAQAAYTPRDNEDWESLGEQGLSEKCLEYLERWRERFFLYGDKPFLQMPAIATARTQPYGGVIPFISSGNTTVLNQSNVEKTLEDAEKALVLITLMNFSLGGKKPDNYIVLSDSYHGKTNDKEKPATAKPGPSVGSKGLLHSFIIGSSISQTVWLNTFTEVELKEVLHQFPSGLGTPPWQVMPRSENCPIAQSLSESLCGRLVGLSRFCLLKDNSLHLSEGIPSRSYEEGVVDPSVAMNTEGKEIRVVWANPDKRPWRELSTLLSFFQHGGGGEYRCLRLACHVERTARILPQFSILSGGLQVSRHATGEQYVTGTNDYVESLVRLDSSQLGAIWFAQLRLEMHLMEKIEKMLYSSVLRYVYVSKNGSKNKKIPKIAKKIAGGATSEFWQLCERNFQSLVGSCDANEEARLARYACRKKFADYARSVYNQHCPKETARQMQSWAKNMPKFGWYLKQEAS